MRVNCSWFCITLTKSSPLSDSQRENVFHTRRILENICSLIVDSGSCCNCWSTRLVEKLNLSIISCSKSYRLQWLTDEEELTVNQQVKVELSVCIYKDKILCDVVPMETCHVLLRTPWKFAKNSIYNGRTNEIIFAHENNNYIFYPLTSSQVLDDQIRLKQKIKIE